MHFLRKICKNAAVSGILPQTPIGLGGWELLPRCIFFLTKDEHKVNTNTRKLF